MRSSSGQHFIALDHLRALAAFLVFTWHFLHSGGGTPVPFEGAPALFPLALVDEGHTGVALFMVLSGYLFAKLLDRKDIYYLAFYWNRFIRLAPLLVVTFTLVGIQQHLQGGSVTEFISGLPRGFLLGTWPNGGWSIIAEVHFYIALPLLLFLSRRSRLLPLAVVLVAICLRAYYFQNNGQVHSVAYWSILGRIDQFVLGIVAFLYAPELARYGKLLLAVFTAFAAFWWWFDVTGGFYLRPTYPSPSSLWIWIPTLEGLGFAALIAWYDARKIDYSSLISRTLQRLGEYSYSIYLLHFFFVTKVAEYIHGNIMDISNFYVGLIWAIAFFIAMQIPGYLSFRFIESPFLKLRARYIKQPEVKRAVVAEGGA